MIRIVTGHICAGKSTFVEANAAPTSVVIDMDRIALAMVAAGTNHHSYPEGVRDVARAARNAAFEEAVRLHDAGMVKDVWAIHAYPSQADLERYRRHGWQVIDIHAEADVLLARAESHRPPEMVQELQARLDRPRVRRVFRSSR